MIDEVRAAVLAGEPRLVEDVKWNSPNFSLDGEDRVTLRTTPKGTVQVILHRGAKTVETPIDFTDPSGRSKRPSNDRAVFDVSGPDDMELVTELVRRWVAA